MSKKMRQHRDATDAYLRTHSVVRARDLIELGFDGCDIRRLVRRGRFTRLGRGVYLNRRAPPTDDQALLVAALRAPKAALCLESSFYLEGLVKTRPTTIWLGLTSKARRPRIDDPAVRFVWLTGVFERLPVETFEFDSVPVTVLDPAAAVVHAFARRDLITEQVAVAAMRALIEERPIQEIRIVRFAVRCGVLDAVEPHLPGRKFETDDVQDAVEPTVTTDVTPNDEVVPPTTVPPMTLPPDDVFWPAA